MTSDQVKTVIAKYRVALKDYLLGEHAKYALCDSYVLALSHANTMLDKIDKFADENHMDKAFRWIGFVQGVLWTCGIYTIDQMRDDNR